MFFKCVFGSYCCYTHWKRGKRKILDMNLKLLEFFYKWEISNVNYDYEDINMTQSIH